MAHSLNIMKKLQENIRAVWSVLVWVGVLFIASAITTTVSAQVSISGTVYEDDGTTTVSSATVSVAVATATPSIHSATTNGSGAYTVSGIATSTGGVTWTGNGLTEYATINSVTFGNGRFVGMREGSNRIIYSDDASSWATTSAAGDNDAWQSVTYGDGKYVAVACGSGTTCNTTVSDRVMYSTDGITWATSTAVGNNDQWQGVTFGNGRFVAVGDTGDRVMYSTNGVTWATSTISGDNDDWYGITYGNGQFVAVGSYTSGLNTYGRVATSPDGITWTERTAPTVTNATWKAVTYGKGLYIAVGISLDTLSYSIIMTSPNGITWTERTASSGEVLSSVVYANGIFVAVGDEGIVGEGVILTSPNGTTWTSRTNGGSYGLNEITYGKGKFVAVGVPKPDDFFEFYNDSIVTASAGFLDSIPITVYVNNNAVDAAIITSVGTTTSSLSGINLVEKSVRVRHAVSGGVIDLSRGEFYDADNDADIPFKNNRSTTTVGSSGVSAGFVIHSGVTVVAPQNIDFYGNYENNGTILSTSSVASFIGNTLQVATGTLSGVSAFDTVEITNTTGNGPTTQSVTFSTALKTKGTFTMLASTSAAFKNAATTTLENISLEGEESSPVWLRSTNSGSSWYLDVPGEQATVAYVNVKDSTATPTIIAATSTDAGNNVNWSFEAGGDNTWNSTDWTLYDLITIDSAQVPSALTDFPVYVNLADLSPQFWSTVTTGGGDIRVTTDEGTPVEIAREVVFASTTAETGELHFKAPTLSSAVDTSFRIYYNGTNPDYAATDTYGQNNTWTKYVSVYHGTSTIDSTGRGNTLSAGGNATYSTSGKFGNSFSFDGTGDYFSDASYSELSAKTVYTVSAWSNLDTIGTTDNTDDSAVFSYRATVDNAEILWYNVNFTSNNGERAYTFNSGDATNSNSPNRVNGVTTPSASIWTHVVGRRNGTQRKLFYNGASEGTSTGDAAATASTDVMRIGGWGGSAGFDFDGRVDEVRIATTSLSDDWVLAEYRNQSTPATFYTVGVVTGSSSIAAHNAGQVSNAFSFQNRTNEELYAFKLVPTTGTTTITNLIVSLTGVKNVDQTDFSNIRLLRDYDSDGQYDATDGAVGGAGVMSITSGAGTITLTGDFTATTTQNFIVVADWNAPDNGSFMRVILQTSGVTSVDTNGTQTIFGSVSAIQHNRNNKGGGGSSAAQDIGGAPPAGNTPQTGGGSSGGEQIGNDPNYRRPTANSGSWSNPQNAYDQINDTYAQDNKAKLASFTNHDFGIAGANQIVGIEVKIEANGVASSNVSVQLSWNAGTSWTSSKTTPTLGLTDSVYTLGGDSDLWGRSWTPTELNNTNFVLRITDPNLQVYVDEIQVRVYYQATGGGGGGGGDI
jgi:Concanavalin A-like lectin/glucanases superfamily